MVSACCTPLIQGYVAKMMGTAPRNPTQATNSFPLKLIFLNGNKRAKTDTGRETKIINRPIKIPTPAIGNNS